MFRSFEWTRKIISIVIFPLIPDKKKTIVRRETNSKNYFLRPLLKLALWAPTTACFSDSHISTASKFYSLASVEMSRKKNGEQKSFVFYWTITERGGWSCVDNPLTTNGLAMLLGLNIPLYIWFHFPITDSIICSTYLDFHDYLFALHLHWIEAWWKRIVKIKRIKKNC